MRQIRTESGASMKGCILLLKSPGGEGDTAVVGYLAGLLPKVPREQIAKRIAGAKPLTLLRGVPEASSAAILRSLRELGAEAAFREDAAAVLPPPPLMAVAPAVPPPPRAAVARAVAPPPPPAKRGGRISRRAALLVGIPTAVILLGSALLAGYLRFRPRMPAARAREWLFSRVVPAASPGNAPAPDGIGLATFFPPQPSVMEVPPREMLAAYRAQLQERPDRRFPMALEILTRRWEQLAALPAGTYRMGGAVYGDREIRVPLLRGGAEVARVSLPLPASFAQGLGTLADWVAALERDNGRPQPAQAETAVDDAAFREALGLVEEVDPREVLLGLQKLDALTKPGARNPRVLLAAARAYAWLWFVLTPDRQPQTDLLPAEGLAFLALAKHLAPDLPAQREEAILAGSMGYRGHATALLAERGGSPPSGSDAAIDAFLRRDLLALRGLRDAGGPEAADLLPHYLLARLYGDLGHGPEAQAAGLALLKRAPSYPAILENIRSGDIGLVRRLTVLYPLDILGRMEARTDPGVLKDGAALEKRLAALSGEEPSGEVSLARFEGLLAAWEPFAQGAEPKFLIDADRVRRVFRILYTDALLLRFNFLLNQWAVVDKATSFAAAVSAAQENNPVVLSMHAELAAELGEAQRAQELAVRIINDPAAGGTLAYWSLMQASFGTRRQLFPAVAARLDGRPYQRYLLGYLHHYTLLDLEAAARCYEVALAQDPYLFDAYAYLAHARGTPEPLERAAVSSPTSYEVAERMGGFLAARFDPASLEKAAAAYGAALRTAPSRYSLRMDYGRVLTKLKRYEEALDSYDVWIRRFGDGGLGTVVMKAERAEVFLARGEPRKALDALDGLVESYQAGVMLTAARAHEKLGKESKAAKLYRATQERYPTATGVACALAGFQWRQGEDREAAQTVALVRPQNRTSSTWYADAFAEALGGASRERILAAVAALRAEGATASEQRSLAHWLDRRGRPDVAVAIAMAASSAQPMDNLISVATAYRFLRRSAGLPAASAYFRSAVPPEARGPALMALYSGGEYEGVLEEVGDPESYAPQVREFIWLQTLIASLALDGRSPAWVERLRAHYAGSGSPDPYFGVGACIQGLLPPEELLGKISTAKQRCEFPYYLGLAARLRGDFAAAATWYQIGLQTGLQNNGEYHWAAEELSHWAHQGMGGRHRLPRDDAEAVMEKMRARG